MERRGLRSAKTALRLGVHQPKITLRIWQARLAGQKVTEIEVDIDKSSEAKPYSKPSANRTNREQEGVQRRLAAA
jgi:hypothetical protein